MITVIKRSGSKVPFDGKKIANAANAAMADIKRPNAALADQIASEIEAELNEDGISEISIHGIERRVEDKLMEKGRKDAARAYIEYRYGKALKRQAESRNKSVFDLLNGTNDYLTRENSNKDASLLSTQRDYMAGEVSKDIAKNIIFDKDIIAAHEAGLIHIHDMDYIAMRMANCCVWNLEDMLQNGTVMSGTYISKPKSLATAMTLTTQIVQQIARSQYGGQTFSIAHLAPFVRISYEKYLKLVKEECEEAGIDYSEEQIAAIAKKRLQKEVRDAVQTLQYQLVSCSVTNGQAPFVTVFMWINEKPEYRKETVMLIEEILKQRMEGIPTKNGHRVSIAFPKLLYVLDDNNTYEGSEYFWLTRLAAECSAKRMVPDYISAKKMREYKEGNVFPCMGCVDGHEVIIYQIDGTTYLESFERAWNRLAKMYPVLDQADSRNKYIDLDDSVKIYDSIKGFVPCRRIIRNIQHSWMQVTLQNGRSIRVTDNHPFETENRGVVLAKDLTTADQIRINKKAVIEGTKKFDPELAWLLGVLVCDGCYDHHVGNSIAASGEDEIAERFSKAVISYLKAMLGGKQKTARRLPYDVLSWNKEARTAMLAGIIDADGYLNNSGSRTVVQVGSTNKELALDELYLAQSLGIETRLYLNHYSSNVKDNIRYEIEFYPTEELVSMITCGKKKAVTRYERTNTSPVSSEVVHVTAVEHYEYEDYSYDVTTDSEHFEVSGIYSHNCRSFLQPYKNSNGDYQFYGR